MTVRRLATPWIATAVLLVCFGSDLGAEELAAVSADPVHRIERAVADQSQDEPMGGMPDAPGLPPADAGPTRLGALALVGALAARRGSVNRIPSSPTRGPPGDPDPPVAFAPLAPSRIDNTPLDPPRRWSTGRGPPTLGSTPTCVPRSARLTTRAQETSP